MKKPLPILTVGGMSLTGCATIDALEYGAPPMGGIAFGLDRSVTLMCEKWDSIRDVIAFPKTQRGQDLMVDASSVVPEKQLRDLHITLRNVAPKAVTE